jgi:hypothetical protein
MNQSGKDIFVGASRKGIRVKGELIRAHGPGAGLESVGVKVAARMGSALERDKELGKAAAEERRVEEIVGMLEARIFAFGESSGLFPTYRFLFRTMRRLAAHFAFFLLLACRSMRAARAAFSAATFQTCS